MAVDGLGVMAFLLGDWLVQQLPRLPEPGWLLLALPLLPWAGRLPRLLLWGLAGLLWALLYAQLQLAQRLPQELDGRDLLVEGRIASIPQATERGVRFDLDVDKLDLDGTTRVWRRGVRLSWYGEVPALRVGERWRLGLRLKPPHGLMNPGGFDFEGWLFHSGIQALGTVRREPPPQRLDEGHWRYGVDRLRQALGAAMAATVPDSPHLGLLQGLAIGETQAVTRAQWDTLARTGTTHLLAISGSHIALVAGLAFFVVRALWSRAGRAPLRLAAPRVGALAAIAAAVGYAALAGFPVPTQRAVLMVTVVMGAMLGGRAHHPGRTLALALLLVLLWDPLAATAAGFWLSFGAVAAILFGLGWRLGQPARWRVWGRVQWLVTVGLLPLLLAIFHQVSLYAPLANLIAVPWLELGVVPVLLAGVLILPLVPSLGGMLLAWADLALAGLWPILDFLADLPGTTWAPPAPPGWAVAAGILGVMLLLAPRGLPGRPLGLLGLVPLLGLPAPQPAAGELWVWVLDVGQRLAVVVRTAAHSLVYDTGPRFGREADAGQRVLVPFLRQAGVPHLDTLIVSHPDQDHQGGSASLRKSLPVRRLLGAEAGAEPCVQGQTWDWDGVRFEVLHPPAAGEFADNDASCVLRLSWAGGALLLPGDIGQAAEGYLITQLPERLAAEVLVAPHHGSDHSSSAAFVAAVHPRAVIYSRGFRNRFGFPRPAVVQRYAALGAVSWDTAELGAVELRLSPGAEPRVQGWRSQARRYWHLEPAAAAEIPIAPQ
jgi:competence protein ComEC